MSMELVRTIASFIVALGVLVIVHELGHYLAARLCGVKVLRFAVGFGRPLAVFRVGADRTEWVVGAIPLGGYVKMLDERDERVAPAEISRAFNRRSVWQRIMIVAAGPAFNLGFAALLYALLFMVGVPEARPILDIPAAGTPASEAGIRRGDEIVAVDGRAVRTWQELRWQVLEAIVERRPVGVEIESATGQRRFTQLSPGTASGPIDDRTFDQIGFRLYRPLLGTTVGQVAAGGAADRAGLRPGDRIASIDGRGIASWEEVVEAIRASAGVRVQLEVERDGVLRKVPVVPDTVRDGTASVGRIGIGPRPDPAMASRLVVEITHGPVEALIRGVERTVEVSVFSLKMLVRMLLGEVSWRNLSGPVTIADYAGQSAQLGWIPFVLFLALVSVSLGVLNLLPIPVLDGGHLMYYFFEVLTGRPVSEKTMEAGQRIGITVLLLAMALAFYNDFSRLLTG